MTHSVVIQGGSLHSPHWLLSWGSDGTVQRSDTQEDRCG